MGNFCKVEEHFMCTGRLGFKNDLGWLVLIGLGQGILKSKKARSEERRVGKEC